MGFYKKGLKGKLDALFAEYVRYRDRYICQRCGTKYDPESPNVNKRYHCAHIEGRGKETVRWDERNAIGLCYGCHKYLDSRPMEKMEWFKEKFGEDRYYKVYEKSLEVGRFRKSDIQELIDYYSDRLEKIK